MKKNIVLLVVFGLILASLHPVQAQQPTKVRKIGFLNQTGAFSANVEAFRQGLRELGYILKARISSLNSDPENNPS